MLELPPRRNDSGHRPGRIRHTACGDSTDDCSWCPTASSQPHAAADGRHSRAGQCCGAELPNSCPEWFLRGKRFGFLRNTQEHPDGGYFKRLFKIYADEFRGKDVLTDENEPEAPWRT